jgi:hypothetical protein
VRNWNGLRAAPILPSLQQEANLGWDANLPLEAADFYYQFKLSDYLTRSNAKYISDGTYPGPYYRISLHKRDSNQQHKRLREHCSTKPDTYYVAPEFTTAADFNESFLSKAITENSRLIKVADCDDIADSEQHYFTFITGDSGWKQHSEPKRHEHSRSGKDLEALYNESRAHWKELTPKFAEDLFEQTVAIVERQLTKEGSRTPELTRTILERPPQQNRVGYLLRTAEILSIYSGTTLVLVGEPPPAP